MLRAIHNSWNRQVTNTRLSVLAPLRSSGTVIWTICCPTPWNRNQVVADIITNLRASHEARTMRISYKIHRHYVKWYQKTNLKFLQKLKEDLHNYLDGTLHKKIMTKKHCNKGNTWSQNLWEQKNGYDLRFSKRGYIHTLSTSLPSGGPCVGRISTCWF